MAITVCFPYFSDFQKLYLWLRVAYLKKAISRWNFSCISPKSTGHVMFPPFRGRGFPVEHGGIPATKWCPSSIAGANNSNFTRTDGWWGYKITYNWGVPHCSHVCSLEGMQLLTLFVRQITWCCYIYIHWLSTQHLFGIIVTTTIEENKIWNHQ